MHVVDLHDATTADARHGDRQEVGLTSGVGRRVDVDLCRLHLSGAHPVSKVVEQRRIDSCLERLGIRAERTTYGAPSLAQARGTLMSQLLPQGECRAEISGPPVPYRLTAGSDRVSDRLLLRVLLAEP